MEIKEWIRTARQHKQLTQEQLGNELGVTKGNVSGWENGRHEPSYAQMVRIEKLTGYSLSHIAGPGRRYVGRDAKTGEITRIVSEAEYHTIALQQKTFSGEPDHPVHEEVWSVLDESIVDKVSDTLLDYPTMQPILSWQHEDELPEGEFVMVPRLEMHLSAGPGTDSSQLQIEFNEKQPQAFRAEWVRQQHLKPKKLAAMTARHNSMEPTIHDGDSLLVDTSQTEVIDGKVYALWYEGGERVKRLYRLPRGGLRIRSDNAAEHPEILLEPEYAGHVRIIGRVVHRSGTGGL